ncbi:hypothetical protein [Arthrobacter caoxuetaonis]|uniref:Uncharacterized protein n=1 Tax=Arthrobacter caoxuetaonis TaxID=2886935 RepID=A0A9X1SE13_9MICC|nr:hypothetical protein [Arthrobacter caoxuetaonis]MCC3299382.1 hypothetical protein [Arthrobacter caoxuetaonis]USQ59125.1 hypothetical protein NF551_18640 [Arthrobacter caoxuetaonis]
MATPRRDIKAITAVLENLTAGQKVTAGFRTPRYGDFTITAEAVKGLERGQLTAGSWLLGTSGKPSKHLQSLAVVTDAADASTEEES